jgi:hypothetical protein
MAPRRSSPREPAGSSPDNEQALAETLVRAASNGDEQRRIGARAYRHSRARCGWSVVAAEVAALYDVAALPRDQKATRA